MNADIHYCFLKPADAEQFKELRLSSLKEEPEAFFFTFDEMQHKPLEFWQSLLARDYMIGAFSGGELRGFAGLWPEEGEKICHRAYLGSVYIAPQVRGKGAARGMIERLLEKARQTGIELVRLSTNKKNPITVGLYQSLGFEPYGVEKKFLKLADGSYIDEVMMVKYLS